MTDNKSDKEQEKLLQGFIMMDLKDLGPAKMERTIQGKWNSIVYITGGNGIIQIDFDEFSALENRIFFIEKYKVWNINKTNNLRGYLVQFTDLFYNHIYTGNPKLKSDQTLIGNIPPFIRINQHDKNEWRLVLNTLSYEYLSAKTNSREIICLELKIIMLMYRRNSMFSVKVFESRRKKQLLNEFRKLVNIRFVTLRSAKDYARELNITPNYLNALCQEFYLKTASEIIVERMILEAKRLLMHSRFSISEVAYKLGFKDNSYFGRYFKKEAGMTPQNFRSSCFYPPKFNTK